MIKIPSHKHPVIFSVGINHRTAPLEVRERVTINEEKLPVALNCYIDDLKECMIISTCNRTELYGVTNGRGFDSDYIKHKLIEFTGADNTVKTNHFYELILGSSAAQLFNVASSLDSMVVGDSQVMHQVKRSYQVASDNGFTGKVLNQIVQKALHAAKKVKSSTSLFEGAFSISYAAVELAAKIFGDLKNLTALVIGAGETAELTLNNLVKKNVKKVFITNRTRKNAEELLKKLNCTGSYECEILDFSDFKNSLHLADIIISSTGASNYVLNYDEYKNIVKKKKGEPVLIIDIAVPRDIDPEIDKLGNVFLKNIDDLNSIVDENYDKRMSVIPEAEKIIRFELMEFLNWYYTIPVQPAIKYIQSNSNGQAGLQIKEIRNFLTDNITGIYNKIILGTESCNEELEHYYRLIEKLEEINKNIEKQVDGQQ